MVVSTLAVVLASAVVVVLVPVVVVLVPVDVRPADASPVVMEVGDGPEADDPLVTSGPLEPMDSLPVGWKHAKSPQPKMKSTACRTRSTRPR